MCTVLYIYTELISRRSSFSSCFRVSAQSAENVTTFPYYIIISLFASFGFNLWKTDQVTTMSTDELQIANNNLWGYTVYYKGY